MIEIVLSIFALLIAMPVMRILATMLELISDVVVANRD